MLLRDRRPPGILNGVGRVVGRVGKGWGKRGWGGEGGRKSAGKTHPLDLTVGLGTHGNVLITDKSRIEGEILGRSPFFK